METLQKRTLEERILTWTQIIGIVVAGLWAAYTFGYQEWTKPKSVPANITLDLDLKKLGTADREEGERQKRLLAVEVTASAKNTSSRMVYILPSVLLIYASKVCLEYHESDSFCRNIKNALNSEEVAYLEERYVRRKPEAFPIVAAKLFSLDDTLNPGETVKHTTIIHVPQDQYDLLAANFTLESTTHKGLKLKWNLDENKIEPEASFYRQTSDGLEKLQENEYQKLVEQASVTSELSLWK